MTPETLHQRIMLHELRTILLDETREGFHVPVKFGALIDEYPFDKVFYLQFADWLDNHNDSEANDLGALIRIHCELIGRLGHDYISRGNYQEIHSSQHPFQRDLGVSLITAHSHEWPVELLRRRWEIVQGLYPPPEQLAFTDDEINPQRWIVTPRQLGRTTRMLTDVLRYCCSCRDSHNVLVVGKDVRHTGQLREQFLLLFDELWDNKDYERASHQINFDPNIQIYGNKVFFDLPFPDNRPRRGPNDLTCIGGPIHGQIQTVDNPYGLNVPELPPIEPVIRGTEDVMASVRYTVHHYERRIFVFPGMWPHEEEREFLVHQSLTGNDQEVIRLIRDLPLLNQVRETAIFQHWACMSYSKD